jgi:hypothetical protein
MRTDTVSSCGTRGNPVTIIGSASIAFGYLLLLLSLCKYFRPPCPTVPARPTSRECAARSARPSADVDRPAVCHVLRAHDDEATPATAAGTCIVRSGSSASRAAHVNCPGKVDRLAVQHNTSSAETAGCSTGAAVAALRSPVYEVDIGGRESRPRD